MQKMAPSWKEGRFVLRNYSLLASVLILAVFLSGCLNTLPPSSSPGLTPPGNQQKNSLTGLVQDANSGLALWSGQVTLTNAHNGYNTSIRSGAFEFQDIAPGAYTLTIEKVFYRPLKKQVVITGANTSVTEKMTPIFTVGEIDLFARLVHAEAKGEPYRGQVAVASSVLNRVLHSDYPNTLSGIINQVVVSGGRRYYQYEPVLNGAIKAPASQTAKDAVNDALVGWDPSLNATGFFAPAKVGSSSWVWNRTPTVTIGNHRFFR